MKYDAIRRQICSFHFDPRIAKQYAILAQSISNQDFKSFLKDEKYEFIKLFEKNDLKCLFVIKNAILHVVIQAPDNIKEIYKTPESSIVSPYGGYNTAAKIHKDFSDAYNLIRHEIHEQFKSNCMATVTIGHGFGGAIAFLAALDLKELNSMLRLECPIEAWLYGSPKIGNTEFTQWSSRSVDCFHIVHRGDFIPDFPKYYSQIYGKIKIGKFTFLKKLKYHPLEMYISELEDLIVKDRTV